MVAENGTGKRTARNGLHIRVPSCITDPPVSSKALAAAAARIADRLIATREVDQKLGETVLFTALHTCAIYATTAPHEASDSQARQDKWASRWTALRDYLINQNVGLAYVMAGRFRPHHVEWDDVRGEAFYALVRAVEGFKPWLGFRFSTYACNAVRRALIHLGKKATQYRIRLSVGHESTFEQPLAADTDSELYLDRLNCALAQNLAELTDREVMILNQRFLRNGGEALTLSGIGDVMSLSKERVRQIQKRALSKLRGVLQADRVLQ